jgi:hypothetical protein
MRVVVWLFCPPGSATSTRVPGAGTHVEDPSGAVFVDFDIAAPLVRAAVRVEARGSMLARVNSKRSCMLEYADLVVVVCGGAGGGGGGGGG